jgi:hypothetical protein
MPMAVGASRGAATAGVDPLPSNKPISLATNTCFAAMKPIPIRMIGIGWDLGHNVPPC